MDWKSCTLSFGSEWENLKLRNLLVPIGILDMPLYVY